MICFVLVLEIIYQLSSVFMSSISIDKIPNQVCSYLYFLLLLLQTDFSSYQVEYFDAGGRLPNA